MKKNRKHVARETIVVEFEGSSRIFKCSKKRLIEAVSHFPHIYKTSRNDYNASVRSIRNENYVQLVDYICNKVGFKNPTAAEQAVLEQTFRSVWRSVRDAYRKSVKQDNVRSYKYSKLMEFYRPSCDNNQPEFSMEFLTAQSARILAECENQDTTRSDSSNNSINEETEYLNSIDEDCSNKTDCDFDIIEDHNYHTQAEDDLSTETFQLYIEEVNEDDEDLEEIQEENREVPNEIELHTTNFDYIQSNLTDLGPLINKLNTEQVLKFLEIIIKFLRNPDSYLSD